MTRYFQGLGDDSEDKARDIWIREIDLRHAKFCHMKAFFMPEYCLKIVKHSHPMTPECGHSTHSGDSGAGQFTVLFGVG